MKTLSVIIPARCARDCIPQAIDAVTLRRRLHMCNIGRIDARREMLNCAALLRKRPRTKCARS